MSITKKIACIIPARLNSSRFPKKILASLVGKSLLQHTWEAATKTNFFSDVTIAIDAQETESVVKGFGAKYIMTSENCNSGTDRLIEVISKEKLDADIFVNWQADDPFLSLQMLHTLLKTSQTDQSDIWTLKKVIVEQSEILSPNTVKVVCNVDDYALYFSRNPIPYHTSKHPVALPSDHAKDSTDGQNKRNRCAKEIYYKHIGIYAFTKDALQKIGILEQSYAEKVEKLEQLRFLHNNMKIKVHTTCQEVVGVNTPEDLQRAENFIKQNFINL